MNSHNYIKDQLVVWPSIIFDILARSSSEPSAEEREQVKKVARNLLHDL